MSFANILFDDGSVPGDGIALLTFNRPAKLNALNAQTMQELATALDEVHKNPAIRALILTGAGDRAFIAGADINELAVRSPLESQRMSEAGQVTLRRLETMGKPSVAAINGFALGGGLEVAMCCTVRFGTPDAKFGQPEAKLGIPPGYGGTQRLPRLVGRGRALEMLLAGDPVDAETALRIGLINRILPAADLVEQSRIWLKKVLENAPVALQLVMQAVDIGLDCGLDAGLRFEAQAFGVACATEDRDEGTRAFLEKRKAAFNGK
jgi:enoyl-CoA hydratase